MPRLGRLSDLLVPVVAPSCPWSRSLSRNLTDFDFDLVVALPARRFCPRRDDGSALLAG